MFVCIVVSSVGVCLFDRCSVRVDRAYGRAIGNLKSVVDKLNEEGRLLEECGVVLSVVLTGPNDDEDEENDDSNSDDETNNNYKTWNWAGRNNITNVYIQCKRISTNTPPQHRDDDDDDELIERRQQKQQHQQQQQHQQHPQHQQQQQQQQQRKVIDNTTIVYNEKEASFSC